LVGKFKFEGENGAGAATTPGKLAFRQTNERIDRGTSTRKTGSGSGAPRDALQNPPSTPYRISRPATEMSERLKTGLEEF
jgi:hypothetical protein